MLDTNILISAMKSSAGTPYKAYAKAATPPNKVILCDQIIDEIRRVFNRKFPDDIHMIESFFAVSLFETAAIKYNIDILITGDKNFLEAGLKNPRIMTASDFINR